MTPRRFALPRRAWPAAAALAMLSALAASPLFTPGWYLSHEELTPLEKVVALAAEFRSGDPYPRWLFDSYGGKGSPYFNFYSPAFYFAAAALHAAGVPLTASLKIPAALLFFAGAWGMFLWIGRHGGRLGGALAAILYLFAPYHFVDLYVRGALAEFSALAVLPYLFLGIDLSLEPGRRRAGAAVVAVAASLVPLTHHVSTLMIAPFALVYSLARCRAMGRPWRGLLAPWAGALAGAGLSAFYWLPLLLERRHLFDVAGALTSGFYAYDNHFASLGQLLSPAWGFGVPYYGPGREMSRQVGILLLGTTVLCAAALARVRRPRRRFALLLLTLGGLALFMTTAASAFVYRAVPLLAYVQFPWRFLGPLGLFLAGSGAVLGALPRVRRFGLPLAALVAALSIAVSTGQRAVSQTVQQDFARLEVDLLANRGIGALTNQNDYLPRWAAPGLIASRPPLQPYAEGATVGDVRRVGRELRFTVAGGGEPARVVVPWNYFPGWRASAAGRRIPVRPSAEGFLLLTVPPGTSEVRVWFGTTRPRVAGWLLAAGTLASLLGTAVWTRRESAGPGLPHRAVAS